MNWKHISCNATIIHVIYSKMYTINCMFLFTFINYIATSESTLNNTMILKGNKN